LAALFSAAKLPQPGAPVALAFEARPFALKALAYSVAPFAWLSRAEASEPSLHPTLERNGAKQSVFVAGVCPMLNSGTYKSIQATGKIGNRKCKANLLQSLVLIKFQGGSFALRTAIRAS